MPHRIGGVFVVFFLCVGLGGCAAYQYGYSSSDYGGKFIKVDSEWGEKRLQQAMDFDSTVLGLVSLGYKPEYIYEVTEDDFYFLSSKASYHFERGFFTTDSEVERIQKIPDFLVQEMDEFDITLENKKRNQSKPVLPKKQIGKPTIAVLQETSGETRRKNIYSGVEIYKMYSPAVHLIVSLSLDTEENVTEASLGSRVMIKPNIMVTNYHVVDGKDVTVSQKKQISEETVRWKLLIKSEQDDLALFYNEKEYPYVDKYVPVEEVSIGEKVYAIGSPKNLENTLSDGIVSGKRVVEGKEFIQTTVSITSGSSGGALFNESGGLIGITTSGLEEGNLNFAIPIDDVARLLAKLKEKL